MISMISGQATWPIARFCRFGAISERTRPIVIATKPMSSLKARTRTASSARPSERDDLVETAFWRRELLDWASMIETVRPLSGLERDLLG